MMPLSLAEIAPIPFPLWSAAEMMLGLWPLAACALAVGLAIFLCKYAIGLILRWIGVPSAEESAYQKYSQRRQRNEEWKARYSQENDEEDDDEARDRYEDSDDDLDGEDDLTEDYDGEDDSEDDSDFEGFSDDDFGDDDDDD